MDFIMSLMPLLFLVVILIYPFGTLANETYKAVFSTDKVPTLTAILNYIPFYNYIVTRKYLYNKALSTIILTILTFLCFAFRAIAYFVFPTNLVVMMISVFVAIGGLAMWYITMAWTAGTLAILTKRGIITIILSFLLPPLGAFIVSKNMRKYFNALKEEVKDEFAGDYN